SGSSGLADSPAAAAAVSSGSACASWAASLLVAADSGAAGSAGVFVVSCFALSVMGASFAYSPLVRATRYKCPARLAADGQAAGLHRVKQSAGLIGADGELRDTDGEARRVLKADVLDVHPGGAGGVEQAGKLSRPVGEDDLDHGEVSWLAAVLARDAAGTRLAPVEQARGRGRPGRGGWCPRGKAGEEACG